MSGESTIERNRAVRQEDGPDIASPEEQEDILKEMKKNADSADFVTKNLEPYDRVRGWERRLVRTQRAYEAIKKIFAAVGKWQARQLGYTNENQNRAMENVRSNLSKITTQDSGEELIKVKAELLRNGVSLEELHKGLDELITLKQADPRLFLSPERMRFDHDAITPNGSHLDFLIEDVKKSKELNSVELEALIEKDGSDQEGLYRNRLSELQSRNRFLSERLNLPGNVESGYEE